ncbi:MAG: tetratricopeptide repeat protein [Ferruginibacter sp.]
MNWKTFIVFSISGFLVSFPQNIIGCGDSIDPYDYYTSFFHQDLSEANGYRPFYYTGYNFLFDEQEPVEVSDLLAKEWGAYCGPSVTEKDAKELVYKFSRKDIYNLYTTIEKQRPLPVPDSVSNNSMSNYFTLSKNLEALGYILYAKQVEPYVVGNTDSWELVVRDSLKMAMLIKNGQQLYSATKTNFIQQRYAYQLVRLALYSRRYADAIRFYEAYAAVDKTNSVLQQLTLALKAGALFKTGKAKEAAYLFSKAFNSSIAKRVSNYLGFVWSIARGSESKDYLELCKTNEEKAGMLALFALGSTDNELTTLKDIYLLHPASEQLEVLAVREINKLEQKYFTPSLQKQKGGSSFYYYFKNEKTDSVLSEAEEETRSLAAFLHEVANNKNIRNNGLFETGAAYTAYIMKDYSSCKKYLATAKEMHLSQKVKDQWKLTSLLLTITENDRMDHAFEEQLLSSLQWLKERAASEKIAGEDFSIMYQWKKIYRDLFSEILSRRYHLAGNYSKEALCIGAADYAVSPGTEAYYSKGVNFLRTKLESKDVEKLYALLTGKQRNKFEDFLITHNSINASLVTEFAGTSYLREYDYSNAIKWFKKSSDKKSLVINKNPFTDLLYDQEEPLKSESAFTTNKIAFAETMLRLMQQVATDKGNAGKYFYKIATALYNMTYYGHTWELVQYDRSGSDGYRIPKDANSFYKEYYGCFAAHDYFEKAMIASGDKNFKARCLFMMAKCSQKQIPGPSHTELNYNWDAIGAAQNIYWAKFRDNRYFTELKKEYSNTVFYKEAYNSCSFLRDYIEKKN